jgi:hypothetical protein
MDIKTGEIIIFLPFFFLFQLKSVVIKLDYNTNKFPLAENQRVRGWTRGGRVGG